MKRRLLLAVVCALAWMTLGAGGLRAARFHSACHSAAVPPAAAPAGAADPALDCFTAELDRWMPAWLAEYHVPGAAIAIVRRGEPVWERGYGLADVARRVPVDTSSMFGVASISKTATAWGVMVLVERGQLALDAPVERYLKRWRLPPSGYDPREVTIRRLLSHSAGLSSPQYTGRLPDTPAPSLEALLDGWDGGVYLQYPPGQRFLYSDGSYLLLQMVIEDVTGQPFPVFMQQAVLDPLGIPGAGFAWQPDRQPRTVTSYDEWLRPLPQYVYVEKAPAGLFMTAGDLARLAAAAIPGPGETPGGAGRPAGSGVLSPQTAAGMLRPAVTTQGVDRWIYADAYGYGYFLETLPGGQPYAYHVGGNLNGITDFSLLPAQGDGLVVMTNSMSGQELLAEVLAAWTGWLDTGQTTMGGIIRFARFVLGAFAGACFGWGLGWGVEALVGLARGQRRLALPGLRALALGAAAAAYLAWGYPFFQISIPSQSAALVVGICTLGLGGLLDGLARRLPAQPPLPGA
ncbi:MAG: serine hydrolase domain-containing protein [Chloroflexota bacterium]